MAFNSDDFPTPLCPTTTLARPPTKPRNRSTPNPLAAETSSNAVSHPAVDADQRLQIGPIDQIDFVDAQHRLNSVLLGRDQKAIDQVRLDPRFGGAGDDENLVDICDQDMLPAAARAGQHSAARLDSLDDPVARTVDAKRNPIAGHDDVPLIGAERFEQAAGGAFMQSAVVGLHGAGQSVDRKNSAAVANGFVDRRLNGKTAGFRVAGLADDRALSRQFAFAADSFLARGIERFVVVGIEATSEIAWPRANIPILAKRGPDLLLLFRHPRCFGPSNRPVGILHLSNAVAELIVAISARRFDGLALLARQRLLRQAGPF